MQANELRESIIYKQLGIYLSWSIFHADLLDSKFNTQKSQIFFLTQRSSILLSFEGKAPAPYTFVPFGGGPRMCPGKEYARLEILTFMHNVVTKFKLEKVDPYEKITYSPSPTPANGLLVCLDPMKN